MIAPRGGPVGLRITLLVTDATIVIGTTNDTPLVVGTPITKILLGTTNVIIHPTKIVPRQKVWFSGAAVIHWRLAPI